MSEEHAYAYEAGYRDGSIHYELEHCPACKNVADLQEALAENESLRELVAKYSAAAKYLCGFSHCNECNLDCASVFGDVPSGWNCARMLLDKKARKLGVEVTS